MDYKTAKYISDIKTKAHLCRINCKFDQCPAFKSCPQLPFQMDKADMRKKSRIFFVFEGGAQDDSTYGFPAVSNQGVYFRMRFLTPFLTETGDVPYMITNLVRNALVDAGGAPRGALGDEFLYCWDHFYGELMKHKPEVLVCFGNTAFGQLYRRAKNKNELPPADAHGVGKLRGKPVKMELATDYSPLVFTTYAPGYLLKTPAAAKFYSITTAAGKLEVGEDLARVVEYFCPHKKSEKTMIEVKKVELLDTVDKAVGFIDYLTRGLPKNEYFDLAFDTETDNLNKVHNNRFLSWQFSYRQSEAFFIPIDHPERPVFAKMEDKARLITAFQKLLDSSTAETRIKWILMHNAKFDLGVLYGLFKILPRGTIPVWDTQLAMHWLDENRKSMSALLDGSPYSLKTLGKEFFVNTKNEPFTYSSEQLAARSEGELVNLAFEDLVEYGGTDTILTWQLKQEQMKMAKKQPSHALPKLERFMKYYFSPASRAVALMECNGLYVSRPQIKYLQGTESPIWNRLDQIENIELQNRPEVLVFREKFRKIIEGESKVSYADIWDDNNDGDLPHFNPNKKDQETPFYLEFLNLTPLKVSKKTDQASLDADFLKHYSDRSVYTNLPELTSYKDFYTVPCGHNDDGDPLFETNPLQLILEYRALKKLGSTYTTGIEKMVVAPKGDAIDGRIRGNFWLGGTDTGRLSSSDPNMQNLPSGKTALAKEVKNMFQAEPPSRKFPKGTVLVQLDYKTAEVRWAAIFANDRNLIRIFNEAREALMKAFDPMSEMSDEDFSRTQLESDLHRRTASLMYGIPPEKVGKEQRQASKCLIGDTLLYTTEGIVPISSLVSDSDDDNWLQPVTGLSTMARDCESPILRVNHKWVESTVKVETDLGLELEGDDDHELLVWENCRVTAKPLKDLKAGDYLIAPKNNKTWPSVSPKIPSCTEDPEHLLPDFIECRICGQLLGNLNTHLRSHGMDSKSYRKSFPQAQLVSPLMIAQRMKSLLGSKYNIDVPKWPDMMTRELARLLGYLVAEGDGQCYSMSGNVNKSQAMLTDFIACVKECFGLDVAVSEYPELTTTGVIRLPAKVVRFLLSIGLIKGYSDTQRVPWIIFKSTREEVISFLRGYFEGEGSVKDNCICVMSASSGLMKDVQQLLLSLNIASRLFSEDRITPVGRELRTYYGLLLRIRDARVFRDIVGFISSEKTEAAAGLSGTSAGRDYIFGLEELLRELRVKYKRGRRWVIDGKEVRFGERISKGHKSEITHERLDSRPYVLDALKAWSSAEQNNVYRDISWLHHNKATLTPITKVSRIEGRVKVYDIEVLDDSHTFQANGLMSKNCITFGMLYGMGVDTLAADHGWSKEDAQEKMDMFFSAFPSMKKWLDNIPEKARKDGYVETIMGRRRRLWDMFASNDFRNAARANRLAMNSSIQGQSSDAGMIGVFSFLQYLLDNRLERRWLIENVVHDSCLIQVPMEDIEKALPVIQHHFVIGMQDYIAKYFNFALPLPIECEIEIGLKYGDLEKWDGRPATLPKIIDKIQGKAEVLWAKKKETDGRKPSPAWDLVS